MIYLVPPPPPPIISPPIPSKRSNGFEETGGYVGCIIFPLGIGSDIISRRDPTFYSGFYFEAVPSKSSRFKFCSSALVAGTLTSSISSRSPFPAKYA